MTETRWKIFVYSCLIFALSWMSVSAALHKPSIQNEISAPAKGFYAPDFMLDDLYGDSFTLSDHLGQPILLTLWASWCSPCKAEMPAFNQVYQELGPEKVLVLGVNVTSQDDLVNVKAFVEANKLNFPILMDIQGEVADLYRLRGLPMTFFIDSKGVITDIVVGGPMSAGAVRSIFNELLQEK
jgi:peroxiredoxin